MLIAHRGIHNNIDVPENSLLAFKNAYDLNIPIELDVRLTKDLELVVFHDANLKRMTGVDINIEELTLEEVSKLNLLDTHEKIPLLRDLLSLINGQVLVDIEIKETKKIKEITNKLMEMLKYYSGDVIIKSFSPRIIRHLKNIDNSYTYGLLMKQKYKNKFKELFMKSNFVLSYCNPNFLAVSKKLAKTNRFQKLRKIYDIYIWTFQNPDEISKYKQYGDYYICNNLPYEKQIKVK